MTDEFTFKVGDLNVAAKRFGDPKGLPVIALHGWLDNLASFEPIAPYLNHLNIVAIDFLGHGLSDHLPPETIYHFIDAIFHVTEVADQLSWKRFALLGHSMGGGVATLLGGTFPEKISHMIVIEGLGPLSEVTELATEQCRTYWNRIRLLKQKPPRTYASFEAAAEVRASKGYVDLETARILTARGAKSENGTVIWRHDPKLLLPSPIRLTEEQVLIFLKKIETPVCFIKGTHGFNYDEDKMEMRYQAVKSLEKHELMGGHHVHMEHPEAVANVINHFLKKA